MRAFIVEDYEPMRIILKRFLKKNFPIVREVAESETAEEALEEIPQFKPAFVLVDISLPGMDGIEMIRRLKPESNNLGILVVTGHEIELYEKAAHDAGAIDVVSKIDDVKLRKAVKRLIEIYNRNQGGT
jgi:DNA-binding NarL/FixJ family response regulator